MVEVNLLPWRKLQAEYQRKTIKKLLAASFLFIALCVLPMHLWLSYHKDQLLDRNADLQQSINQLEEEQKIFQQSALSQEQKNAVENGIDFNKVLAVLELPIKRVNFSEISRHKNVMVFVGRANSIVDLMRYIRTWSVAKDFASVTVEKLNYISDQAVQFRLRAKEI